MGALSAVRNGPALTLTLQNPGKANALDIEMLAQIDQQVSYVEADETIRVVVLRGASAGTFSSGADVREWAPLTPQQFSHSWIEYGNTIFGRFEGLRCPTVAAIEGICFGGGLELVLCADLRVASLGALFRFPEVGIGAIPGWQGGTRLARIAGRGRALEAVLTMCTLDVNTASAWGVLNAAWPQDQFEQKLAEYVEQLIRISPRAAALSKAAIFCETTIGDFYISAAEEIKTSADSAIGIQAFYNKSTPVF